MITPNFILNLLEEVSDPEIPVLTINDLGIVRGVEILSDEEVNITITPTYSGCPAMDAIAFDIKMKLIANGIKKTNIIYSISPPWSTDWMTEEGKRKLKSYGIAPPQNISILARICGLTLHENLIGSNRNHCWCIGNIRWLGR